MLLEVDNVVKDYRGGVRANDGISLSVDGGEVFGLLGPNGAGKTTLVSQIVALIAPTSGTIEIGGVNVKANPAHAKEGMFVPATGRRSARRVHSDASH